MPDGAVDDGRVLIAHDVVRRFIVDSARVGDVIRVRRWQRVGGPSTLTS